MAGDEREQSLGNLDGANDPNRLFKRARLSYFGRAGYNYKEKYLAEFLWRVDGSYIFQLTDVLVFSWCISRLAFI